MSTVSSLSNSTDASYAMQLAQTSALERSLYNLGSAIQSGDLTTAGSVLTALIQANPQYATSSGSGSTTSGSPINQDFQNLATAISSNDPESAKSAWAQLKTDLASAGVTNISSGSEIAAQAIAQNKVTEDQTILSTLFGGSSAGSSPLDALIGGGSSPAAAGDAMSAAISNWLTYQANGNTSPIPANTIPTDSSLNTTA